MDFFEWIIKNEKIGKDVRKIVKENFFFLLFVSISNHLANFLVSWWIFLFGILLLLLFGCWIWFKRGTSSHESSAIFIVPSPSSRLCVRVWFDMIESHKRKKREKKKNKDEFCEDFHVLSSHFHCTLDCRAKCYIFWLVDKRKSAKVK